MGADDDSPDFRLFVFVIGVLLGFELGLELGFLGSCKEDRWNQIAEAFSDPCTSLDDQVLAVVQGLGDRLGHLQLFAAMFVVGDPSGDTTSGSEDRLEIQYAHAGEPG